MASLLANLSTLGALISDPQLAFAFVSYINTFASLCRRHTSIGSLNSPEIFDIHTNAAWFYQ